MAAVNLADLVKRCRRWLQDEPLELYTTGSVANVGTDTTIAIADTTKIAVGNVLEFDDDTGEMVLVKSITNATTFVAKRAHNGTGFAAHSSGAIMLKNPSWQYDVIEDAIKQTVDTDLWPWIWTFADTTITAANLQTSPRPTWFNLNDLDLGLISVMQPYDSNRKVRFYGERNSGLQVGFKRNLPAALVASGVGVYIPTAYTTQSDITVRTARKHTTTNVEEGAVAEAVVMGALYRLLSSRDLRRHTEDVSVGVGSVRPGSSSQTAQFFKLKFVNARQQAQAELNDKLPLMRVFNR